MPHRWAILMRSLLAILGGYAISALCAGSLALAMSPPPKAVLAGTMLSFVIYCAVAIWAFAARSLARAWLGSGLLALVPTLYLLFAWKPI